MKYSYCKTWPGMLRLLGAVQLLFGGMVVTCVIAYIQRDREWSNFYNGTHSNLSGKSYRGPMTPVILAVVGLSCVITLILMVMGMTMYYRTILLYIPWWPLTEAFTNVALFLLYMSAGIVYLNDLNRGGLCYKTLGVHPVLANLCRVEGGQMVGAAFIFINMLMYLVSYLLCLKIWRYQTARREKERIMNMTKYKRNMLEDEIVKKKIAPTAKSYPGIPTVEEREMFKKKFYEQYEEYKELAREISPTLVKIRQLEDMMAKLPKDGVSKEEQRRIEEVLKKFEQKKNTPSFLKKKERYDELKLILSI